ncbi:hypothetical protein [Sulfitobacter sp.]|uniref:hypothetical protein n=1 Tax=Sulfitobacter sp. TaxID=1903071 RepID=UPI0030012F03
MRSLANGYLQAAGRDARARKQYRYHEKWAEAQAQTKFDSPTIFAHSLPRLREHVSRDLEQDASEREFALACAVTLIDRTSMWVGHPEYTDQNGSYGALTLWRRHVTLGDDGIGLCYTAKGGKKVRCHVKDRTLGRVLHKVGDLPGAEVLTWLDNDGAPHMLSSQALNACFAEGTGEEGLTAKTFRT